MDTEQDFKKWLEENGVDEIAWRDEELLIWLEHYQLGDLVSFIECHDPDIFIEGGVPATIVGGSSCVCVSLNDLLADWDFDLTKIHPKEE